MPLSINEITKGRELIPKKSKLVVGDGFYDRANWVRDAQVSVGGLELFRKWFLECNLDAPLSNVWEFDIGKLVVPGVFFDSDLLSDMAKKYHHITRIVKNHAGDNLFRVSLALISKFFKLNPNHVIHETIDMDEF